MNKNFWQNKYPHGISASIDLTRYPNLLAVFKEVCNKYVDKVAFINKGHSLTYQALNKLSLQFAAYLKQLSGLNRGDRIAIQLPNVLQYPVVTLAILRAGFVVVNTNPNYTQREMKEQFNNADVKAIICIASAAHKLQKILADTSIEHVIISETGDLFCLLQQFITNFSELCINREILPFELPHGVHFIEALKRGAEIASDFTDADDLQADDMAVLQYTGGTTGGAKGVILTHQNLIANMLQCRAFFAPYLVEGQEIVVAPLPLYHIYAFTLHHLVLPGLGAQSILITNPKNIEQLVREIAPYSFTMLMGVNTLFAALCANKRFGKLDFSHFKYAIAGGMTLQAATNSSWKGITKVDICEGYGLTETAPVVASNILEDVKLGTIGIPLPATLCKIVDKQDNELPLGQEGELCVKGPQVMSGYWQQPTETALAFTKDGWLKTGDIAVIQKDGRIRIIDRKKDVILVSGFNVYSNEIEDVVTQLADVIMAAAIGVPDEYSGETVKIFVVLKRGSKLTKQQITSFLHENLVSYKCPKYIEFKKTLPMTTVGKVLRKKLRQAELKKHH